MEDDKKYELYVEGRNDQCIIASIGYQNNLKPDKDKCALLFGEHLVNIKCDNKKSNGSDDTAYELFKDALTIPQQYGAIAIIVDADDIDKKRAQDRLQKFIKIINAATAKEKVYDTNISLSANGIVLSPLKEHSAIYPQLGLWIMPDNKNSGAIESFLWQGGPKTDYQDTYNEVNRIVSELEKKDNPKIMHYIGNHHNKALVHTFLAWVEDPGNPMGTSIDKKCWNINAKLVKDFIDWLARVFC